jgi:hypothetical protein
MGSIVNLAEKIQEHNAAMRRNSRERIRYRNTCAACDGYDCLAPHELRSRELRYLVGTVVMCVRIVLARWRCIVCGRTFTDYPDFRTAV